MSQSQLKNINVLVQSLSKRELEVFMLIGKGFNSKSIATHLKIATTTVDTHRKNIRRKLNIKRTSVKLFEIAFIYTSKYT